MILTFEVDESRESLDIFFDLEGRDQLIKLLTMCDEPGDHQHLFSGDAAGPGYTVTTDGFLEDHKAVAWVTLGVPGPGMKPLKRED